jgi:hypothetical protein
VVAAERLESKTGAVGGLAASKVWWKRGEGCETEREGGGRASEIERASEGEREVGRERESERARESES